MSGVGQWRIELQDHPAYEAGYNDRWKGLDRRAEHTGEAYHAYTVGMQDWDLEHGPQADPPD